MKFLFLFQNFFKISKIYKIFLFEKKEENKNERKVGD